MPEGQSHNKIFMPAGRPSKYSQELATKICEELISGMSLRKICLQSDVPDLTTVIRWAMDPEHEFYQQYADARTHQAELLADGIFDLANGDGDVRRDRLKVDTQKWYLGRIHPKFRPKQDIEHGLTDDLAEILVKARGRAGLASGSE